MRWIVGGKAVERGGASTSQMGRFETELLAQREPRGPCDLSDRVHDHDPPSSAPRHSVEGTAYNGHFGHLLHPLFVFNQRRLERARCAPATCTAPTDGVMSWMVERYKERPSASTSAAIAAFASHGDLRLPRSRRHALAIRLRANKVLQESIVHLLKRPVGRPPKDVRRYHASFSYQAGPGTSPAASRQGRVASTRGSGSLTNLGRPADAYLQRGTSNGSRRARTRLDMAQVRPQSRARLQPRQLHAHPRAARCRTVVTDQPAREACIKIASDWIVRHGRYVTFQMAEVADSSWRHPAPYRPAQFRRQPRHERRHPVPSRPAGSAPGSDRRQKLPFRATNAANWSSIIRIGGTWPHSKANCTSGFEPHSCPGRVPYGESRRPEELPDCQKAHGLHHGRRAGNKKDKLLDPSSRPVPQGQTGGFISAAPPHETKGPRPSASRLKGILDGLNVNRRDSAKNQPPGCPNRRGQLRIHLAFSPRSDAKYEV